MEGGQNARPSRSSGNPTSGVYRKTITHLAAKPVKLILSESILARSPWLLLAFQYLTHCAPGLIDGDIRICARARIGVRNRNFPERSSPDHPRLLFLFPVRIEE